MSVYREGYIWGSEGAQYIGTTTSPGHLTKRFPLGTRMVFDDGREFRYARAGATALVAGNLYQSPVPGANFDTLAVAVAAALGDTSVEITNGATTIAASDFDEAYMVTENTGGVGRAYKISSHDVESAGSAQFTVNLASPDGIREALTTSSKVTLIKNPYDDVIIHDSPPTAIVVGVAVEDTPIAYYGWLQTKGVAAVLIEGTVVIGKRVQPSATTDGAVMPSTSGGDDELTVGKCIEVAPTTDYGAIDLDIA